MGVSEGGATDVMCRAPIGGGKQAPTVELSQRSAAVAGLDAVLHIGDLP
jgi:hypothetical protein